MCMLCVIPPNTTPSRSKLENSALNNPHGFGFAIVVPEENRIIVSKTMNADESINQFLEARAKYQTGHALWHARIATSGVVDITNCHPFVLPDEKHPETTYIGHNGMLDVYEPKGETRSDTRIFVEDLLPAMGGVKALDNPQVWNLLNEFTRGSKVCVLTVSPEAQYEMYLFHEDAGNYDEDGVWWSNKSCELSSYTPYNWRTGTEYANWLKETDQAGDGYYDPAYDMVVCNGCDLAYDWTESSTGDACPSCKTCMLCDTHSDYCMCRKYQNRYTEKATPEGGWIL